MTTLYLTLIICAFLFFEVSHALIHPACTANVSKSDAVCCPTPKGSKLPCGFPHRGICRRVQVYKEPVEKGFEYWFHHDFRMSWPSRIFKRACECVGQYSGPDCGSCWFGYTGKSCQHRLRNVRKNALKLTKKEKTNFWKVLVKSKRLTSPYRVPTIKGWKMGAPWRKVTIHQEMMFRYWFARFPIVTKDKTLCKKRGGKHGVDYGGGYPISPLFHRTFLLYWEQRLNEMAHKHLKISNFTFPYWDFTDAKNCSVCKNDLVGEETKYLDIKAGAYFLHYDCPYASWGAICSMRYRHPCANCGKELKLDSLTRRWMDHKFPTTADVRSILKTPLFYSHRKCQAFAYWLSGGKGCYCNKNKVTMMGRLTEMVHGTFHKKTISANDPLYILVHANIDRLLSRWLWRMIPTSRELPTVWGSMPGACRECTFVSFTPKITLEDMFVDSRSLGYKYDNLDFGKLKEKEVVAEIGQTFTSPNAKCKAKKKTHKEKKKTHTGKKKTHAGKKKTHAGKKKTHNGKKKHTKKHHG